MNTWTPGPWQRALQCRPPGKQPPYNVWNIIGNTSEDERKHSVIATTITDDDDARLIALAPEMAEVLPKLVSLVEAMQRQLGQNFDEEELGEARALLARLEGGQS